MTLFSHIDPIRYEGPDSDNPLAFRHYNRDEMLLGKRMEEHLRIAVCYWHSFCWPGSDVFGDGTLARPWLADPTDPDATRAKLDAAFEFFARLGAPYYCFHDVDAMTAPQSLAEHEANLKSVTELLAEKMTSTGIRLLWGTANLFSHPRYMAGAATSPNPEVFRYAAAQVRYALEATHALQGENYVLWGGREGYDTLLNTDLKQELDQLGRFLNMVVEHKHRIGFTGTLLIEPKPHEPTKHQYDHDTATVYGFLQRYGLEQEIRVNIEANHATLAGHSFEHEIATAQACGIFGSIDINRGDPQNGWDTDQFPNNAADVTAAMLAILRGGGFTTGGFNFDAKLRRQSTDIEDLFHAHIGGMDTLARALRNAVAIIEDGTLDRFLEARYERWAEADAQALLSGEMTLAQAADQARALSQAPTASSGRQEYLENQFNRFT
ncbi:MAG: xylose isomerase [Pseudomonadota bacterium]